MSSRTEKSNDLICPHLGVHSDSLSHMAYASDLNFCHGSKTTSAPVSQGHQREYCLTADFLACPVYRAGSSASFPRDLRRENGRVHSSGTSRRISLSGALPFLLFLFFFALFVLGYFLIDADAPATKPTAALVSPQVENTQDVGDASPSIMPAQETPTLSPVLDNLTATLTPFPTLTLTPSPTLTFTSTPTITHTPSLTPTVPTATPVPMRGLDVPIGKTEKFLVHRISSGENLTALANKYATSIDAILAVNFSITLPVQVGTVVVIPIEQEYSEKLPVFGVYEIIHAEISALEQAIELGADPALFMTFNNCAEGDILFQGDWVLIPR